MRVNFITVVFEGTTRGKDAMIRRVTVGATDDDRWNEDIRLGMNGADPAKRRAELYWVLGWLLSTPKGDQLRTHTDLSRLKAGGVERSHCVAQTLFLRH